MDDKMTYDQFFDIDEKYFPCIDDSAIAGGARWDNTYPHETFIKLLRATENMLGGSTYRSIWIHGAYGTGKSQCAFALKKILEVPEKELETYWNSYDALKEEKGLLAKLEGHRDRGIVTVYRYATGGITSEQKFFLAIQESVREALEKSDRVTYYGENTLKENIIAWLEEEGNKEIFDILLRKSKWRSRFSQSSADEVLDSMKNSSDANELISNILEMNDDAAGVNMMSLDADRLKNWLKDVIEKNHIKIVFFWDEFSNFFKHNRYSLDEFQKVVTLCQQCPFYLVIVTHQAGSVIDNQDESWKVVQQRFNRVQIELPDNIAFNLIGHAFKIKPAAADMWDTYADALNSRLSDSRKAVMKAAKITDQKVIKDIMPLHPMAALVLKNIASSFASNQRSMFDFIKVNDDTKAFQWFISNYGPDDDYPLLTIDMLWDFFYEKGRDNLSPDIQMILDTFPQQNDLRDDEQRVLKTILIMEAIDKRLHGAIDVLKPTEQNISYAFEGITSGLDTACKNIAKMLCKKGILVQTPIGNHKFEYGVAVLAGDQAKINKYKDTIRKNTSTADLVSEGKLSNCLSLSPPLKLRFTENSPSEELTTVTINDFKRIINTMKDREENWHFNAVIAFAKDDKEAKAFRDKIKETVTSGDYNNIIFIDATATPLGEEEFDSYVEYAGMANYYQGDANNIQSARDNNRRATQILTIKWKNRISDGVFTIWSKDCPNGEKVYGASEVGDVLKTIVLRKFPYIPDFENGLKESQFKLSQQKRAALCGIKQEAAGVVANADKAVLSEVWKVDDYWKKSETSGLRISKIKSSVEKLIKDQFDHDKSVSILSIYELLVTKYGYAPSNLTVFLMGFLLKEYSVPKYRCDDQNNNIEEMSPDKLAGMIGDCSKNGKDTFILKMTPEERAFYEITEKAWEIPENTLSSPALASTKVKSKMQSLGLPVWCLKEVDEDGVYYLVDKYIDLVQKEGKEIPQIVNQIGSESLKNPSLTESLKKLLTPEYCKKGMLKFIDHYDDRKLRNLVNLIAINDNRLLSDIEQLFSVEYASLWNLDTGEDQLNKLMVDYTYIKCTNDILNVSVYSKYEADNGWKEKLKYVMCSCEALQDIFPNLKTTFEFLEKIYRGNEILPAQMKQYTEEIDVHSSELKSYFSNEIPAFTKIYNSYLDSLNEEDIKKLKSSKLVGIFGKTRTESNALVKKVADEYRANQTKTKLFEIWKDKTGTKTPADWSTRNRTPILSLISKREYDPARKVFGILNHGAASEKEYKEALEFLNHAEFFEDLNNQEKIDNGFRKLLGNYSKILNDIERVRDALEKVPVGTYEWYSNPNIDDKIEELAKAEYNAGGSDMAISKINSMSNDELKKYLISNVKRNMALGIEIIYGEE